MSATLLRLIDKYLADLPAERDLVQAQEVRDLLLDIRLTFMVLGTDEASPEQRAAEQRAAAVARVNQWQIPPGIDGGPRV